MLPWSQLSRRFQLEELEERRRRRRALGSWVVLTALGWGCGGEAGSNEPRGASAHLAAGYNFLLVTLDTVRADRLGAYGYSTAKTPHLDQLARRGVLFEQAVTTVPLTLPSHATLMSGLLPLDHGLHGNGQGELGADVPTLATVLAAKGYRTGAFVGAFVLDARFGLARGFAAYDDEISASGESSANLEAERPGQVVVDRALTWLSEDPSKPFFAWVHLYDAHAPYTPDEPFASRFPGQPYDGEIAQVDHQVGRLLSWLAERGLTEKTVVVVSGDHGEGLGEHGELTHGLLLYESTLRVPLLIQAPGVLPPGTRISTALSLADVAPTLGGLLAAPLPGSRRLGRNLAMELVERKALPEGEIYAESRYPESFGWSGLAALRKGRLKLISAPRPEFYDLSTDPGELRNLASEEPHARPEVEGFAARLAEWVSAEVARPQQEIDATTHARLAALGYVSPPAARAASAGPRRDPKDAIVLFGQFEQAHWHRLAGRHDEAAKMLGRLVTADPGNSVFRAELAAARRGSGRLDLAVDLLKEAVALAPTDPDAWYNLATALAEQGRPAEARQALRAVLSYDPNRPEALNALGIAYAAEGRLDEARTALARAVELEPGHARAWNNLGNVERDLGRIEPAIESYEQATRLAPDYADPWNGLGTIAAAQDRPAQALSYFEQALDLNPELAEVRLNRAIALELAGDREAAKTAYRDFLSRSATEPALARERQVAERLLARLAEGGPAARPERERR